MLQRRTWIGALLAASLVPIVGFAQNGQGQTPGAQSGTRPGTDTQGRNPAGTETRRGLALQRSEKVIGADIEDSSGQKIGRIDDLILKPNGEIAYAIVSGNSPDTMAKEYPIPWKMVRVQMASSGDRTGEPMAGIDRGAMSDRYVLSLDKERLASAPGFDRTQWPLAGDTGIYTESDRFFGASSVAGTPADRTNRPVEAGMKSPTFFRVSQLRNQAVSDASGMPMGTLGSVVIDPAQGRVNYVTFSTTSTAGANGRTVALPWQTVQASRRDDKDRFELSVPQDRLQSAPEFQNGEENWKRMSDPVYVNQVYTYYSVRPYWSDAGADRTKPVESGTTPGKRDDNEPKRKDNEPKKGNEGGERKSTPPH
jgi:sporulation protein YlmC with PRC-barrel domain